MIKQKFKLLIVDDSKMLGEKIRERLSELENIIIIGHALNGSEAIPIIINQTPDIVLLDIRMPVMDGFDLLGWIRNRFAQIKIIMLSNHSTESYRQKCKALGADYFFDKSTEFELLPDSINEIIQEQQ